MHMSYGKNFTQQNLTGTHLSKYRISLFRVHNDKIPLMFVFQSSYKKLRNRLVKLFYEASYRVTEHDEFHLRDDKKIIQHFRRKGGSNGAGTESI